MPNDENDVKKIVDDIEKEAVQNLSEEDRKTVEKYTNNDNNIVENEVSFTEENPYDADVSTKKGFVKESFEFMEAVVQSIILLILVFTFVFRIVGVVGDSMLPGLIGENERTNAIGDRLIISQLFYTPKQGDVVVVTQPIEDTNDPIIKRVIATEGQTVDIDEQKRVVLVDGVEISESYLGAYGITDKRDLELPVTLKKGEVFVMGDNRQNSLDSRWKRVGIIDERYIMGKAVFRIFPFNRIGLVK